MSAARDLQASAWDAECRHDVDTLLSHFHPDAAFHAAGAQSPEVGHAAIRKMTEDFYRSFPELEIEIRNEFGNGESSAAFEFRARLTDMDGGVSTLDGICLVTIEDGVFTSVRYYEDAPVPVTG